MPKDLNGTELNIGDMVTLPCVITHIHADARLCELEIQAFHGNNPIVVCNGNAVLLLSKPEKGNPKVVAITIGI